MEKLKQLKPLIIICLLLFLILGLFLLMIILSPKKKPEVPKLYITPTLYPTKIIKEPTTPPYITRVPTITVNTTVGKITISDVNMNNFYRQYVKMNNRGDVLITDKKEFQIVYLPTFQQFLISIVSSPFSENRKKGEMEFISILGISKQDACKLKVFINTPQYANPDYAGQNYPLSFCNI